MTNLAHYVAVLLISLLLNAAGVRAQPAAEPAASSTSSISFPVQPPGVAGLPVTALDASSSGSVSFQQYDGHRLTEVGLIILHISSITFRGNHPQGYNMNGPDIQTPEQCAERCARTTNCTAFAVCTKRNGCGRGCAAYAGANPTADNDVGGVDSYVSGPPVPFLGFGFFTYPFYYLNGCATRNGSLTTDTTDKWPWGMCCAHRVLNVTESTFIPNPSVSGDDEFISGVLARPPNCPDGLPFSICSKCNALPQEQQRAACIKCASFFRLNNSVQEATTLQDQTYDYCPRCFLVYSTPAASAQCVACLQSNDAAGLPVQSCLLPKA